MNGLITFVLLTLGLAIASVNLSMPLVSTGYALQQGAIFDSFMVICFSIAGIGLLLAYNSR